MAAILVGTCNYHDDFLPSKKIYLFELDKIQGTLLVVKTFPTVRNPQYFVKNGSHLYLCTDTAATTGSVAAYQWDAKAQSLEFLNMQESCGRHPCHLSFDSTQKFVFVANYTGGSVAVLPLSDDGHVGPAADSKYHTGTLLPSLVDRQESAHPHSIYQDPYVHKWVLVPDLGLDTVFVYEFSPSHGALVGASSSSRHFRFPRGSGPRHLAFHPTLPIAYVLQELTGRLSALQLDAATGQLRELQSINTLPEGVACNRGHHMGAADVHVAPSGKVIYVTNRSDCTLVSLTIDDAGLLTVRDRISTQGETPRNFAISDDGAHIVLVNQSTRTVVVVATGDSGAMAIVSQTSVDEPPTFVCFA